MATKGTTSAAAAAAASSTATSGNHGLSYWKEQLLTNEDPGHMHKTLGILCLCSFAWRLSMMGERDMGFRDYPALTLPTVALHWSLTLSSFVFRIPARRINSGDRIWPEYRLHALVFLSRSLLIMLLYYYEDVFHIRQPKYEWNFIIVMLTLAAAAVSSWSVGSNQSNSIRNLDAHPAVQFFFSYMQLGGTAGCLWGLRRYSLMFFMAFIVQVNPFLMTLRRKNLLSKTTVVTTYGFGLAFAVWLVLSEYYYYSPEPGWNAVLGQGLIDNIAMLLRLGPRVPVLRVVQDNKYLLWFIMGMLMRYIRPWFDEELSTEKLVLCQVMRVASLGYGIYKGFFAQPRHATSHEPIKKSV